MVLVSKELVIYVALAMGLWQCAPATKILSSKYTGGENQMHVDPEIERKIQSKPEEIAKVILICTKFTKDLQKEIEDAGFQIDSLKQANQGLIYGGIRLKDVPKLQKISEIESITLDSEQLAF